jgi:hypothetical protein
VTRPAVAFFVVLSLLSAVDSPAQTPLVTLEGSSTIVFADAGGTRKATLAVKPTTARPKKDEEPSVIEFSLGDLRNPAPGEPLKAKWRLATDPANAPAALEFELDDTVRRPGLYTVYIAPLPVSAPTERLKVQIEIKPAKLALPQKLVVARTINLLFQTSELQPRLDARESDRATRVPKLTVTRASAFSGTLPIAAGVTPGSDPLDLPAGQSIEVPYSVDQDVPLGTVTGTLRFAATELAEPVALDYEVRTRLTNWFIPLVIAFGFLVGWLVRKRLVEIAELGEARDRAQTLLAKVKKSLADRPDADFKAAVMTLRDDLEVAAKNKNAAAIIDATTKLDDGWRAALVEFGRRKTAAAEKLAELKSLAGPPLPLPSGTEPRLAAARDAAAQASNALAANNVTEAENDLKSHEKLTEDVWRIALAWQEHIAGIARLFQTTPLGLPAPVQTQFAERAKTVALDRIKTAATFETPALRRALFVEFNAEFRDARILFGELSTRLGFEWNLIAKAVEPIRPKLQPQDDLLADAITAFQRDLQQAADDPKAFAATLEKRLEELDTHWRAALIAKAPPTMQAEKLVALKALADSRQYLQLATALVAASSGFLGGEVVAAESGVVPWLTMSIERALPAAVERPDAVTPESPDPVVALTPGDARLLQSVLLAVVYIAVYWMLNADGFGTSIKDLATLFVTSFGLDLSAEGILKLKK